MVGPFLSYSYRRERSGQAPQKEYSRGSLAPKARMKYLITVFVSIAAIIAGITSAIAQAHGAFIGNAWLRPPYVYGYAATAILALIGIVTGIKTTRAERKSIADEKHKQIRIRLATLMRQWQEIFTGLKAATDDYRYTELIKNATVWANDAVSLLKEAGHPTDAELLSQVGHVELASDQLARCAHIPEWKRNEVARFLLYYQTLDQIRSNRRF